MIIYAPIVPSTLRAFTITNDDKNTPDKIIVNFTHNVAVDVNSVSGFHLIVKSLTKNNNIVCESSRYILGSDKTEIKRIIEKGEVEFSRFEVFEKIIPSNYYKIQIAYRYDYKDPTDGQNKYGYGPYSSVGVSRCIGIKPSISVKGLSASETNNDTIDYVGQYFSQEKSETVHQYNFQVRDPQNTIIKDSGWLTPHYGNMVFTLDKELENEKIYNLIFSVITVNNYTDSVSYKIQKNVEDYPIQFDGSICAEQDIEAFENGYVLIKLINNTNITPTGNFRLLRKKIDEEFWNELTLFSLTKLSDLSQFVWKDYSIEQNTFYDYAIQQFEEINGIRTYSEKLQTEKPFCAKFEAVFLADEDYQLRVAFNPKVSSFKENVLITKTDTIGGKYPFIFQNGQVQYKEFPISGLLSYQTDWNAFGKTQDLTLDNFKREKDFKLQILSWLNNGKAKLFRSIAEGNYIVQTANSSLTPQDSLGRMLHDFSSTCYEIMDFSFANLKNNNIINFPQFKDLEKDTKKIFYGIDGIAGSGDYTNYKFAYLDNSAASFKVELKDINKNILLIDQYGAIFNQTPELTDDQEIKILQNGNIRISAVGVEGLDTPWKIIQTLNLDNKQSSNDFLMAIKWANKETKVENSSLINYTNQPLKKLYTINTSTPCEITIIKSDYTSEILNLQEGENNIGLNNILQIRNPMGATLEIYGVFGSSIKNSYLLDGFILNDNNSILNGGEGL